MYSNRHVLVCTLDAVVSKSTSDCDYDRKYVVQLSSWEFSTSLELIGSVFRHIKEPSTESNKFIFPVLLNTLPETETEDLLKWSVLTAKDLLKLGVCDQDIQQYVLPLRASKKVTKHSATIARKFNSHKDDMETADSSASSCEEESTEHELDDLDMFKESLGDLAEDAERRHTSHQDLDTDTLSAMEIRESLGHEQHAAADDEDRSVLEASAMESDSRLVESVELQRINTAVKNKKLNLMSVQISEAVNSLEANGLSEEAASIEVALNSDKVMGNTNYDDHGGDATGPGTLTIFIDSLFFLCKNSLTCEYDCYRFTMYRLSRIKTVQVSNDESRTRGPLGPH